MDNEIITVKGEKHYLWPMKLHNGNTTKCRCCLYYLPYYKASQYYDGECTSGAMNTERGYVHRKDGNDHVAAGQTACKWFFLKEDDDG